MSLNRSSSSSLTSFAMAPIHLPANPRMHLYKERLRHSMPPKRGHPVCHLDEFTQKAKLLVPRAEPILLIIFAFLQQL
jgi:hypothetical protein